MSTIISFPQRRKLPAPPAPAPRKAPPVITLPALLRSVAAPAPDPFPERNGLTRYNSLVITHSSLPALPPGRYHDSLFEGIDIFELDPGATVEGMVQEIEDLEKTIAEYKRDCDGMEEQNGNAVELVSTLIHELESLAAAPRITKADIKRLQQIIGDSMFET